MSVQAQLPATYIEKESARPSPQWLKTYAGINAEDPTGLQTDAQGNIYISGNFYERGKIGKVSFYKRASGLFYLAKMDKAGNVLWVCGIKTGEFKGSAQTRSLMMDKEGHLVVAGVCFQGDCTFTSTDSAGAITVKPQGVNPFMAWYDKDGKLLRVAMDDTAADVTGAVMDRTGHIYITGYYTVPPPHGGVGKNSLMVAKYDALGRNIWRRNIPATERLLGMCIATGTKGEVWVGGSIKGTASFDTSTVTVNGITGFYLARFGPNGDAQQVIMPARVADCTVLDLAMDAEDNLYVAGNFNSTMGFPESNPQLPILRGDAYGNKYQNAYLAKVSQGKVQWLYQVNGYLDYVMHLQCGADGHIYLTGFCHGARFTSATRLEDINGDQQNMSAFIARYNTGGNLDWVKAFAIRTGHHLFNASVTGKDLYLHGSFDAKLVAGDSAVMMPNAGNGYIMKYNTDILSDTSAGAANIEKYIAANKPAANTATDCRCKVTIPPHTGMPGLLTSLLDAKALSAVAGLTFNDATALLDKRFYSGLQNTNNNEAAFYALRLVNYKPLTFRSTPADATLNLTPCMDPATHHDEMDITVNISHPIHKYIPNFDEEKFDGTGLAYFKVLLAITRMDNRKLLMHVFDVYSESYTPVQVVEKVNKEAGIQVQLPDTATRLDLATAMTIEMKAKKVDVAKTVYNAFFSPGREFTGVSGEVEDAFGAFFSGLMGNFEIKDINHVIHTNAALSFEVKKFSMDYPVTLLHRCNDVREEPMRDSANNYVPSAALFDVQRVTYNNIKDTRIELPGAENGCFPLSEISGTGIMIEPVSFKPVVNFPVARGNENNWEMQHPHEPDSLLYLRHRWDDSRDGFTGVDVQVAHVLFPYGNKKLRLVSNNMQVGGNFVGGVITLEAVPVGDGKYILKQGDKTVDISHDGLAAELNKMNLDCYYIQDLPSRSKRPEHDINIYFLVERQ